MKVKIEIIEGVAGKSIYINDTRIAGPKPWGGGHTSAAFDVEQQSICDCIKYLCDDDDERLQDGFVCPICNDSGIDAVGNCPVDEEEVEEEYDCPIHGKCGGVGGECPRC